MKLDDKELNYGHTDEAMMIFTSSYGLLLLGGSHDFFYVSNNGTQNDKFHARHGLAELKSSSSSEWSENECMKFPTDIVSGALVELGANIWIFGGHSRKGEI